MRLWDWQGTGVASTVCAAPRFMPDSAPLYMTRTVISGILVLAAMATAGSNLRSEDNPAVVAPSAAFAPAATAALKAMKDRADALHVNGVAVVAYAPGDSVTSWSSRMQVVGNMIKAPSATDKGSNLLGIAYAKASEMASTLKESGTAGRPPLTGEFGWQGGVVAKGRTGILIAAFSGGRSDDDVAISRAGLAVLAQSL